MTADWIAVDFGGAPAMRTWAMETVVSRLRLAAGGVDDMAKVDAVQADAVSRPFRLSLDALVAAA